MTQARMYPSEVPSHWPLVSLIVPCLDERNHIASLLDALASQDYPDGRLEILIVDGGSCDGTREIVLERASRDPRVLLVDNPDRNKPAALNRGIRASSGEIVCRIDAHAYYPQDYVRLCVLNLICTDADNVGGFRETRPSEETSMGKAIAISIASPFASGGATYRSGSAERRWVDTVFCGTYRRSTFEEIGLFDERLLRGQDREFNARLIRSGGRILFVPEIRCAYYARSQFGSFVKWVFDGGATPFVASRLTASRVWSSRNLVPGFFVLTLAGLPIAHFSGGGAAALWWTGLGAYLSLCLCFALRESFRARALSVAPVLFVVFVVTHVVYGVGSLAGMLGVATHFGWGRV